MHAPSPQPVDWSGSQHMLLKRYGKVTAANGMIYWAITVNVFDDIQDRVLAFCRRASPERIYEIGCSTGIFTEHMRDSCQTADIYSVDVNLEALLQAAERVNTGRAKPVHFDNRDGYFQNPDLEPESVDVVVTLNNLIYVAKHMDPGELEWALGNIARVIKPNGYLVIGSRTSYVVLQKGDAGFRLDEHMVIEGEEPDFRPFFTGLCVDAIGLLITQMKGARYESLNSISIPGSCVQNNVPYLDSLISFEDLTIYDSGFPGNHLTGINSLKHNTTNYLNYRYHQEIKLIEILPKNT